MVRKLAILFCTLCDSNFGPDRHGRRRPFSSWMKRLANLKSLHTDSSPTVTTQRLNIPMKAKKDSVSKNNPYFSSGRTDTGHLSSPTGLSCQRSRHSSISQSKHSASNSHDGQVHPKSRAPTLATTAETAISDATPSGAGTSATAAKTDGDPNSTFSSPAQSVRSMTTTLTTVQSTAAPMMNGSATAQTQHSTPTGSSLYPAQPATAVPAHLAPHSHPATYHSAVANNLLTDDASILTLASSSKRRRRNSVDTNASVKALAPASMFGGSRESLPLSVLSGTIIHPGADTASLRDANARSALNAERASLISASGVAAPALASERNSYIGSKHGDGASVRSGLPGAGHGRNDSVSGSIGGRDGKDHKEKDKEREREMVTAPTSPLVDGSGTGTPYINGQIAGAGNLSPEKSNWVDREGDGHNDDEIQMGDRDGGDKDGE